MSRPVLLLTMTALLLSGCQSRFKNLSSLLSSSSRTTVIQATANSSIGISKVEFYVNGALTCTVTNPPYNCPWDVPAGAGVQYQLQTKAYDTKGQIGNSQVVQVTSD